MSPVKAAQPQVKMSHEKFVSDFTVKHLSIAYCVVTEIAMKLKIVTLLLVFLATASSGLAQDRMLGQSQGYQLNESHLVPSVGLLNFLIQGQVSQQELQYLVQACVQEFQTNPPAFMQGLQGLNNSIAQAQNINDPMMLAEFRQKLLGEFYGAASQLPANQIPPYIQILFQRVPVVAYDANRKVVLTQTDLQAAMLYVQELHAYQGQNVTMEQLNTMAYQLSNNFSQLDAQNQTMLANGSLVLAIFRANVAQMNQAQLQQNYQQNYQQAYNSAPAYSSSGNSAAAQQMDNWHNQQTMKIYQDTMNQNHVTMMNVINNMGGSDDYWTLEPVNY
jgi:hypothetical protein